jgi:hypothetical protein
MRQVAELENGIRDQSTRLMHGLPHIYKYKHYGWSRNFIESTNKMTILTAANQIGKSTAQIRKCVDWATRVAMWKTLWPKKNPTQFWYLYPDRETATREWKHKWLDLMPAAEFKDHEIFGWKETFKERCIFSVEFNSGVTIYFRTYSQDAKNLQSGTVDAIFCDEELPEHLYDELKARLFDSRGYFSMVFTATLGQDMWRRAIEGVGDSELFPNAHKQQISMRDCQFFEDGTQGAYALQDIVDIEAGCRSETERQRRVDGRFVSEIGRKYDKFDAARHFVAPFKIPEKWQKRLAVDVGSGGARGHPPAIVWIAIRTDFRYGVVYKAWRGDDGDTYTAGDIYQKYVELCMGEPVHIRKFDWAAKDFGTIAERAGEYFEPAEKSHELGESALNTLFKNDMLGLFSGDMEIAKLGGELTSILKGKAKKDLADDLADALRYAAVDVPWDWTALKGLPSEEEKIKARNKKLGKKLTDKQLVEQEIRERRGQFVDEGNETVGDWDEIGAVCDEWNDQYG